MAFMINVKWAVVPLVCIVVEVFHVASAASVKRSQRRVRVLNVHDLTGSSSADLPVAETTDDWAEDVHAAALPKTQENIKCAPTNEMSSIDLLGKCSASQQIENVTFDATGKQEGIVAGPSDKALPKIVTAVTAVGNMNLAVHIPSGLLELSVKRIEALQIEATRRGLLQERRHSKFGHQTLHTYLHMAAKDFPDVIDNLWSLTTVANEAAGWGVTSRGNLKKSLRCLEIIEYSPRSHNAPLRHSGWHDDGDTAFTVSVLLSEPGRDFEGGDVEVRRKVSGADSKEKVQVTPRIGDVVIWRGWEEHRVLPVTRGTRRVLVAEWRIGSKAASSSDVRPVDSEAALQQLLRLDPLSPTLYKNLGNLILAKGKVNAAASIYTAGLGKDPMYAEGHYHLGSLMLEHGMIDVAEKHFRSALQFESLHVECQNNIGVILDRKGEKRAAEKMYLAALETNPEHAEAHDNLGVLQASLGDIGSAEKSFEAAVKANPEHVNGHRNLGIIMKKRGNLEGAEKSLRIVTELLPQSADAHSSLAHVLAMRGKSIDAARSFKASFEIDPDHSIARRSLLSHHKLVFQIDPCLDEPVAQQPKCFQMLVQLGSLINSAGPVINVGDVITSAKYYIAILQGEEPSRPSASYVENLFDSYAPKFEEHLIASLRYDGPRLLQREMQMAAAQTKLVQFQRAADLGCGTGLMGPILRDLGVQWLEGVDVSLKMLEKASKKQIHAGYDVLLKADLQSIFRPIASEARTQERNEFPVIQSVGVDQEKQIPSGERDLFDLVTMVDVAEYVGDLEGVFETVQRWTMSGGLFGLTVLIGAQSEVFDNYILVPPGLHYIHRPEYIRGLAQKYNFRVLRDTQTVLRYQSGAPVRAQVFVLQA